MSLKVRLVAFFEKQSHYVGNNERLQVNTAQFVANNVSKGGWRGNSVTLEKEKYTQALLYRGHRKL